MSIITAHSQAIVGEPEVVEDASVAEQSAAWKLLKDAAIAIRTALLRDGTAYIQAGGGIVADSRPPSEDQESQNKAAAVVRARTRAGSAHGGRRAHRSASPTGSRVATAITPPRSNARACADASPTTGSGV